MVDKKLLQDLKEKFEAGPAEAQLEDTLLVFEFFKQAAQENETIQDFLDGEDIRVQLYLTDEDTWFWLKALGADIDYAEGKVEEPSFVFKTTMENAVGVIFGEVDPTAAYMAGKVTIEGNLQDALAFNDLILDAIEYFEELIEDLD